MQFYILRNKESIFQNISTIFQKFVIDSDYSI